jgi:dsRNA-specific ribonuclease
VPDALPPPPPAIVITGTALPEAKAELVDTVERITQRQIAQSPTHELDQLLKDVPGVQPFRRSDARIGHPSSQAFAIHCVSGKSHRCAGHGGHRRYGSVERATPRILWLGTRLR